MNTIVTIPGTTTTMTLTELHEKLKNGEVTETQLGQIINNLSAEVAQKELEWLNDCLKHIQEGNLLADLPEPPTGQGDAGGAIKGMNNLSAQDMLFDMYAMMALLAKLAQEQRASAREVRYSEMQAQTNALLGAAQQIREAAHERLMGAIASGVCQIGAGLVQGIAAGISMAKTASALEEMNAGTAQVASSSVGALEDGIELEDMGGGSSTADTGASTDAARRTMSDAELNARITKASAWSSVGGGLAQLAGGTGSIASGAKEQEAAGEDAHKAELEAEAKSHESAADQAREQMQQMQDMLRDIRDKLNAIEQSRAETTRSIARNI